MNKTGRKTPNWENYIMRKSGQSIRAEIARSFGVFAKAAILARRERALEEWVDKIPAHKWGTA